MTMMIEFQKKFRVIEHKLYESEHWIWSLRPHQATVGAGIISLKRECSAFGDLKRQEYCDLGNIIKVIEPTLKSTFSYDVINYLMLMMFDKHIHYHVLPRYESPVIVLGKTWHDSSWPALPELLGEALSDQALEELGLLIQSNVISAAI